MSYLDITNVTKVNREEYRFTLKGKRYTYKTYEWAKFTECYSSDEDGVFTSPWDEYRIGKFMPLAPDPYEAIQQFFQRFGNSTMPPKETR